MTRLTPAQVQEIEQIYQYRSDAEALHIARLIASHQAQCTAIDAVSIEIQMLQRAFTRMEAEATRLREKYYELIMAVGTKFPDESRHATALRYIRKAEERGCSPDCVATQQAFTGQEENDDRG